MNFLKKWYIYQKERFPVIIYGLYVLCIVIAVFCFGNYLAKINYETINFINSPEPYKINYFMIIPMFIVAFLQFFMIRIVDEFKDYEEDCKYRKYRPVPRGLISLKELKIVFIICAILQFLITIYINVKLVILLLFVWAFFLIMSKGFFIKKFLDKHLLIEVFLDELLMPILVIYLIGFIQYSNSLIKLYFSDLYIILLISYFVSWTVEIARKIRCKEDEEEGVKTYTALFGIPKAVLILFILETILVFLQIKIIGVENLKWIIPIYLLINIINLLFIKIKNKIFAKITELSANIFIMIIYLSTLLLII